MTKAKAKRKNAESGAGSADSNGAVRDASKAIPLSDQARARLGEKLRDYLETLAILRDAYGVPEDYRFDQNSWEFRPPE